MPAKAGIHQKKTRVEERALLGPGLRRGDGGNG